MLSKNELANLAQDGLRKELSQAKRELSVLRIKHGAHQLKEVYNLKTLKKYVARIETYLTMEAKGEVRTVKPERVKKSVSGAQQRAKTTKATLPSTETTETEQSALGAQQGKKIAKKKTEETINSAE